MASLYNTSNNARKVLIVVVALVIVILAYDTITSFQRANQGTQVVARRFYMNPDNKFGDLPTPSIQNISLAEGSNPSYSLRTPNFGSFPDVAYVYQVEKPGEKLGTFEAVRSRAAIVGFAQDLLREEGRNIIWNQRDNTKTLTFGRDSLTWNLSTDYTTNIEAIRDKTITSQTAIYGRNSLTLLRRIVLNTDSYNFGFREAQQSITLANIGPSGQFFEVQSAAQAEYVRVDLFRKLNFADLKPDNELPELNPGEQEPTAVTGVAYRDDPRVGIFSAIVSNNLTSYSTDLFEFNFTDFNYTGEVGKYSIITPADAWTRIQNGQASLVSIETQESDQFSDFPNVNVRRFEADPLKTSLGYFEPREWNGYVTPIYIFQGTATLDSGRLANFTFFVNAIRERASTAN